MTAVTLVWGTTSRAWNVLVDLGSHWVWLASGATPSGAFRAVPPWGHRQGLVYPFVAESAVCFFGEDSFAEFTPAVSVAVVEDCQASPLRV